MIKANKRNFLFEEVKQTAPERNGFDLSHENKQTCRANKVYPFECFEALPNDDFELQVEQFVRLQPSLSPTMHRIKAYWHWFFVPNRLCWKHWEEFISRGNGKKLPADQTYTPPEPPYVTFYDMLRFHPSFYRFFNDNRLTITNIASTDVENNIVAITAAFPEFIVKDLKDNFNPSAAGSPILSNIRALIYIRTPRVANALQIPDSALPIIALTASGSSVSHTFSWVELSNNPNEHLNINDAVNLFESQHDTYVVDALGYYTNVKISIFPFVGVLRNWIEYYRDENLDDDLTDMLDWFMSITGHVLPSTATEASYLYRLFSLNYRCWEKDYFTTATQLPQKAPDVEIPGTGSTLHASGSVIGDVTSTITGTGNIDTELTWSQQYLDQGSSTATGDASFIDGRLSVSPNDHPVFHKHTLKASNLANNLTVSSTLSNARVNVEGTDSQLQPTTVAQVRRAFALQRWFEKAVRTGTRYIESLKAFFNSDAGDARLQRSEYIGGSSSPVQISDVVQTSATDDNSDTVQGNLAGYGIVSDTSDFIRYHVPEHGFIIGMFSILGRTSYSQGIPRMFLRETWLDYAWPEFEHIGEQGIKQIELYAAPLSQDILAIDKPSNNVYNSLALQTPDEIFGYQSRYADYKQIPDRFGSGFSSSLDFWSLGRIFNSKPTLSSAFVHSNLSDRNFAVVGNDRENQQLGLTADPDQYDEAYDYDTYICDFWVDCKKVTSLTLYSEPI